MKVYNRFAEEGSPERVLAENVDAIVLELVSGIEIQIYGEQTGIDIRTLDGTFSIDPYGPTKLKIRVLLDFDPNI